MRLLDRQECTDRLRLIFPQGIVEDPRAVTSPLAGAAVFVCVYCGAFDGHNPVRPSMVLWMCDGVVRRAADASPEQFDEDRTRWLRATSSHAALIALLAEWGIRHEPWYADNSREPLRDETFRERLRLGAMTHDSSVPTTSPRPDWTLRGEFAALFRPDLQGDELAEEIGIWHATAGQFWFVEAVATDGEIHEERKRQLLDWAAEPGIEPERCGFISGFLSRTHEAFRRRASRLAWGTYVWFADEPERLVGLHESPRGGT